MNSFKLPKLNIKTKKQAFLAALMFLLLHFGIMWGIPWQKLDLGAYGNWLVHFLELALLFIFHKLFDLPFLWRLKLNKRFFSFLFIGVLFALFSLLFINIVSIKVPFKYIPHYAFQLLFVAPLLEELIYRHILLQLLAKADFQGLFPVNFSSAIFSLAHFIIIFKMDPFFHSFIIFQTFYTYFLGWVCGVCVLKEKSLSGAYLIHFIFNFIFYLAIEYNFTP